MKATNLKGSEFIKLLKKFGKTKNIKVELIQRRGKGSHSTLVFGDRFTIIRCLKDELKTGTLNAMLKQLGVTIEELRSS